MDPRNKSEDDGALEIIYALTGNRSLSLLTKGVSYTQSEP